MIKLYTTSIMKAAMTIVIGLSALNVFSQEKESGVHVGVTYPISSQGTSSKNCSNRFSLNMLVGVSREETAFVVSGLASTIRQSASGFQAAGIFNKIGDKARGFTAAGVMNVYGNGEGVQAAGFANFSSGHVQGMQAAGFMNTVSSIKGAQASGFINLADSVNGSQVSGFVNIAEDVEGTQVAGFVNMARKVKGVQIAGFINLADSSEYPIGIINIIANGEQHLGVTTDDNLSTIIALRSGSKKIYGIVGLGYTFKNDKEVLAVHYGFGAHFFPRKNFRLNTEATVTRLENFSSGEFIKTSLSVLPAIKIANRLELFGGPALNYVSTTSDDGRNLVDHYLWSHTSTNDNNRLHGIYIGYTAGVHFKL